ncbi:hypothetical protein UFOVP1124_21 [uncultured Caudovirales phage]|uniref:Uncharacterized protein n=1 Tax=uncultured Caudovirales phage TaxID=2100421 RepID=A0A6J5QIW6_9CAUD|nr:hypothetical protein UFOVP1124_21 [uncultured Caudovirales phage]
MDPEDVLTVKFFREWGDYTPGQVATLPAAFARHMHDCGVAVFVEPPAEPGPDGVVVERAVKRLGR